MILKVLLFCVLIFLIAEIYTSLKVQECDVASPDAILLLGSGTQIQEALLQERLLRAVSAFQKHSTTRVVISGTSAEAAVMFEFLQKHIPQNVLSVHDSATRTKDSFLFLKNISPTAQNILIASNEFHRRRSLALAAHYGFCAGWISQPKIYKTEWKHRVREILGRLRFFGDGITGQ